MSVRRRKISKKMFDKLCKMLNVQVLICLYVFALGCVFVYINHDINATIKELEQEINSNMFQLMGEEGKVYYDVDYLSHETKIEQIDVPKISRFDDIRTLYALDHENNKNGWSIYKIRLKKALDGELAIIVSKEFPYAVGYRKHDSFYYTPKSVREIVQSSLEYEQKNVQAGVYNKILKGLNNFTNDAFEIQRINNHTWSTTGTMLYDEKKTSSDIIYSTSIYTDTYKCFIASSQPICIYKAVMRNDNMLKILWSRLLKAVVIITICFIIFYIIVNNIKGKDNSDKFQFGRFVNNLCNTKGRISRFEYLTYILLILGTFGLTSFKYNSGLLAALNNTIIGDILEICILAFLLICFVMAIAFFCQSARRCHDLNKSGWFQFVPLFHLWLLFAKGDANENQYDINNISTGQNANVNATSTTSTKRERIVKCVLLAIVLSSLIVALINGFTQKKSHADYKPQIDNINTTNSNSMDNGHEYVTNNPQSDIDAQSIHNVSTNKSTTNVQATVPGDYPDASIRILTASELRGYNKEELKLMRNEIFARHGFIFKTDKMQKHFAAKQWYEPKHNDVNSMLTDIEQQNIKTIQQLEK